MPQSYDALTKAHDANEAKAKPPRPYQFDVVLTPEEQDELGKLSPNDRRTRFREIQTARGVVR